MAGSGGLAVCTGAGGLMSTAAAACHMYKQVVCLISSAAVVCQTPMCVKCHLYKWCFCFICTADAVCHKYEQVLSVKSADNVLCQFLKQVCVL